MSDFVIRIPRKRGYECCYYKEREMATINHSSGADIIVPSNNGTTYRGLAGDDTYIISNGISANASITIVDTSGANKIQLVDGLSIASSKFAADAVQLTLSNVL